MLYLFFGIFCTFFGYRCFKATMFLTGFVFGSLVVYLICLEEEVLPMWANTTIGKEFWPIFRGGSRQDFTESSRIEYLWKSNFQVSNINWIFEIRIELIRILLHFQNTIRVKYEYLKSSSRIESNIQDFSKSRVDSSRFRVESNNCRIIQGIVW